jgi:N-acetylated-alpha-linked acidic dipeptidase
MPLYAGDPLTPFVAATPDAERLALADSPTLMKIPVLPISYGDALPILSAIGGPVAPASWRGGLPDTYHIGPGPARVHLRVAFNWDLAPAYNVIARLRGSTHPDEWIVRGNHRDAWVFGAQDPASGMVALMEEARAVGELVRAGHRPKRTIVYASWDAEEPGLLGSTEWAEEYADELRGKAAVYINTDGNGRGFLGVGGSHTLERFVNEIARDVVDPQTGVSVAERLNARRAVSDSDATLEDGTLSGHFEISPLGSGSDYSPFLQHLGIASLNIGYGGESGGGSYHSTYDTFEYYTRYGDPDFAYGIALVQTAGRATLRLANADVLPLRFTNFATTVSGYLDEVQELAEQKRDETARNNRLVAAGAFELAADPTLTYVPPPAEDEVPHLNFAPMLNVLGELADASKAYDKLITDGLPALSESASTELGAALIATERAMTDDGGLPRRPWYRHQIYAPGYYTGYGVKTLPGIREAIEERKWDEASDEIVAAAATIERVTAAIEAATGIINANVATKD